RQTVAVWGGGRVCACRGERDPRPADRTDDGVNGVPDRVDPRDLVGNELDQVERDRGADDPVVVEDLVLRGQIDPAVAARKAEDRPGSVQGEAAPEPQPPRPARPGHAAD